MASSNKIDLKEVNKNKKGLRLPKINNPFKKQNGIKRDEEGKFAVKHGAGGLVSSRKIDLKRALPVIFVVALVGGLFVFKSFASGSQAQVTSWYRTCSNREPDSGGLAYWSGRLDKGEHVWAVADAFMKSANVTSCTYPDVPKTAASPKPPAATVQPAPAATTTPAPVATSSTNSANQALVTSFYKACNYRSVPATGSEAFRYWENKIAASSAATVWPNFRDTSRNNGITCPDAMPGGSTATTTTTSPNTTSSGPLKDAQAWSTLGAAHVANAKKENQATYNLSKKVVVGKNDLSTIAQKEGYVRGALAQMQTGKGKAQGLYNQAISNLATRPQGPAILAEVDIIQGQISSLAGYIVNIAADYKRAEVTYEANLNFFGALADQSRKDADCRSRGGTPTWTGGCNEPPAPATGGSGGSSYDSEVGREEVRDMPAGITQQQKIDYARGDCNSRPSYEITRRITGGERGEIRDVYHQGNNTWCNNRLERVTWIICNSSYRVSENVSGTIKVCVKKSAASTNSVNAKKKDQCLTTAPEVSHRKKWKWKYVKTNLGIGTIGMNQWSHVKQTKTDKWVWSSQDNACYLQQGSWIDDDYKCKSGDCSG